MLFLPQRLLRHPPRKPLHHRHHPVHRRLVQLPLRPRPRRRTTLPRLRHRHVPPRNHPHRHRPRHRRRLPRLRLRQRLRPIHGPRTGSRPRFPLHRRKGILRPGRSGGVSSHGRRLDRRPLRGHSSLGVGYHRGVLRLEWYFPNADAFDIRVEKLRNVLDRDVGGSASRFRMLCAVQVGLWWEYGGGGGAFVGSFGSALFLY
mmetsp:Transcript_12321/g.25242  ORF Transcript_12321/g.25242 Transcript_12321/m.25242 type:complete len:202 (+) Transcript_12321:158-763(+)